MAYSSKERKEFYNKKYQVIKEYYDIRAYDRQRYYNDKRHDYEKKHDLLMKKYDTYLHDRKLASRNRQSLVIIDSLGSFGDSILSARNGILVTMFTIFFLLSMIAVYLGNDNLTIGHFLNNLESTQFAKITPNVSEWLNNLKSSMTITADWGIFNFFRSFLNSFGSSLSLLINLVIGFVDIIQFILAFAGIIF